VSEFKYLSVCVDRGRRCAGQHGAWVANVSWQQ